MKLKAISQVITFIFISFTLSAEIEIHSQNYFSLNFVTEINAPKSKVFESFGKIENWWSPDHTWGGDASKFKFDLSEHALLESLNSGWVRHMEIIYWAPNRVVLKGGLGPLQSEAVSGVMIWGFSETKNAATRVSVTYKVSGYTKDGLPSWAPVVNQVLQQQLNRFQLELEK